MRIYPHHHGNIRPLFFRNELIVDDHSVSLRFSLACRLLSSYSLVVTKTKIMLVSHFSITQSDRCTHGTLDNLNVRIGGNSCTTRPTSISLCPGDTKRQNEISQISFWLRYPQNLRLFMTAARPTYISIEAAILFDTTAAS